MKIKKRSYNNFSRSEKAGNTRIKIIEAVGQLWAKYGISEITLELIAEEAGVTTRTVLRKFGTKEALIEECLKSDATNVTIGRYHCIVGDLDSILKSLLADYEFMGEAAIRTIYLEPEMEIARKIGEIGRKEHRKWCAEMFAPYLPKVNSTNYETDLNAFIASTEIYLWKLLRKDMKLTEEQTFTVFMNMIKGLVLNYNKNSCHE